MQSKKLVSGLVETPETMDFEFRRQFVFNELTSNSRETFNSANDFLKKVVPKNIFVWTKKLKLKSFQL